MTKRVTLKLKSRQAVVPVVLTLFIFVLGTGLSAASRDLSKKPTASKYGKFVSSVPVRQEVMFAEDGHPIIRVSASTRAPQDMDMEEFASSQWCWKTTCVHVQVSCSGATDVDGCSVHCPGLGTFTCEPR